MVSESRGPSRRRYQARIRDGRRIVWLGNCDSIEERDARTKQAREELHARRASSDDILDDDPFSQHAECTGEMRLCAAMLLQARRDLRGRGVHQRRAARQWILSDDVTTYSFNFCCDVLGYDVERTRRLLGGDAWRREPSTRLSIVRKDSAQN